MTSEQNEEHFRFALHEDVKRFEKGGWVSLGPLQGHHGRYSVLMERKEAVMDDKQTSAFPSGTGIGLGMSLRDWFAGQALVGLLAESAHPQSVGSHNEIEHLVGTAFDFADAMLAARSTKGGT